ncbi:hypothetical protein BB559_000053 [Furculomyces boomerangus]|uniref:Uncharacterized protein n=1 Tax=Furculomyces boomerangus TaxID=61424 RepID=A0A2T9Z6H1_9FUNG|nr:hypothetical protein BB559_000053 [Furculomyces boomerangus]
MESKNKELKKKHLLFKCKNKRRSQSNNSLKPRDKKQQTYKKYKNKISNMNHRTVHRTNLQHIYKVKNPELNQTQEHKIETKNRNKHGNLNFEMDFGTGKLELWCELWNKKSWTKTLEHGNSNFGVNFGTKILDQSTDQEPTKTHKRIKNTKSLKTTNPRIRLFNLDNSKNLKKKVPRASMEASKLKYKLWNSEIDTQATMNPKEINKTLVSTSSTALTTPNNTNISRNKSRKPFLLGSHKTLPNIEEKISAIPEQVVSLSQNEITLIPIPALVSPGSEDGPGSSSNLYSLANSLCKKGEDPKYIYYMLKECSGTRKYLSMDYLSKKKISRLFIYGFHYMNVLRTIKMLSIFGVDIKKVFGLEFVSYNTLEIIIRSDYCNEFVGVSSTLELPDTSNEVFEVLKTVKSSFLSKYKEILCKIPKDDINKLFSEIFKEL